MPLYLDACAVIKRYIDEGDGATAVMDEIFDRPSFWGGLTSSEWLLLEVVSALAKKVRDGSISARTFRRLLERFRTDLEAFALISSRSEDIEAAAELVGSNPKVRFHPGDAIHLQTALVLQSESGGLPFVLVTVDKGLGRLAQDLGMPVFNPSTQSEADLRRLVHGG